MAHKELANKHGIHKMLLEDGSLQRKKDAKNMQPNDPDTPNANPGCLLDFHLKA